uniref:Uncharacterized protein n=1 Tax=Caenorhabditis japonica TaxID=281687 RepID=A0A8R1EVD1_CAEJA
MNDLSRLQLKRPEQRPATRRREGEARCNYAKAGDHAWLQSLNHQQSSSRSRLPRSVYVLSPYCRINREPTRCAGAGT